MDNHVFRFLWNLMQIFLFLLWHHWILSVSSQAVGVGLTVRTIQHSHGSCLGDATGARQGLEEKKETNTMLATRPVGDTAVGLWLAPSRPVVAQGTSACAPVLEPVETLLVWR